jgi:hypothetical protein
MKLQARHLLGLMLLGALALHAALKGMALLQEMLWMCHVATALMALGLLTGWYRAVAVAFLLHTGFGTGTWVLDIVVTGVTTPSSVLVHVLPLVAGGLEVRRMGWPRGVVLPTWVFFCGWVIFCRWVTDPAFNVNISHKPWPFLADVAGGMWLSWALNWTIMLTGFLLADTALRNLHCSKLFLSSSQPHNLPRASPRCANPSRDSLQ